MVDTKEVIEGEEFSIQYRAEGEPDGEPDFSPLNKDFEVSSTSQSSSISVINGTVTKKLIWNLAIFAKKAGELTLPAINFGSDKSQSLDIKVIKTNTSSASTPAEDLFIEVNASTLESFVQAEIVLTVKLYMLGQFVGGNITEPQFSTDQVVLKTIKPEDQEIAYVQSRETKNGKQYKVFTAKFAVYPLTSGELSLEPIVYKSKQVVSQRRRTDIFGRRQNVTKSRRAQSNPITFKILPAVTSKADQPWIPASEVRIIETWPQDPPVFKVGESTTRTITLAALGLSSAQIPTLNLPLSPSIKQYADKPVIQDQLVGQGFLGVRQEKIALVPTKAGELVLPEVQVQWWNTIDKKFEIAKIAQRTIKVLPAEITSTEPVVVTQPTTPTAIGPTGNCPENKLIPTPATEKNIIWQVASAILALLWLITIILYWRARSSCEKQAMSAEKAKQQPTKPTLKPLKLSTENENAIQANQDLLVWGKAMFPQYSINNIEELAYYLDAPSKIEISHLLTVVYSQNPSTWHRGEALFQAISDWNKNFQPNKTPEAALAPLYMTD